MVIENIAGLGASQINKLASKPDKNQLNFAEMVKNNINETNNLLNMADEHTKDFAVGDMQNLHEVMIAVEEANLALNYTMQIRNKVIEGYQEIMRMQI
jgi:flagellar hook-basal body complex protein FliE